MVRRLSLADKLVAIGTAFLLVALLAIGFLTWASWHFENETMVALQTERLRADVRGMQMARQVGAPDRFGHLQQQFSRRLDALTSERGAGLLHLPRGVAEPRRYAPIRTAWTLAQQDAPGQGEAWPTAAGDAALAELSLKVDAFARAAQEAISLWAARVHFAHLLLLLLAASAAAVSVALGHALVLRPIGRLRRVMERVRKGELQTRMPVQTHDELGQLAAGFNQMARALEASRHGLERKVREKTASIEERSRQLTALYGVSALAARASDLNELTKGFAQRMRSVAGCDGTAVRLSDQDNQRYSLFAAEGLPASLLQHEPELVEGACACCPIPGDTELRVIAVTGEDGGLPYCHDAGFRAVVSIPIEWQQRILGQVSLFYRGEATPAESTLHLLQAMTRHFASAMENFRVAALEREAAVTSERKLIARELHDSIAQSLAFLKIQVELLRGALRQGDASGRDASLAELEAGVQECLTDVRELLVHFRTRTHDEDIEGALRATLSKFEHQTGIRTRLAISGHGVPLPPDVQIQVLHMVQEALSNVRKHAHADQVWLHVQRHPFWRFEVHDNGVGFEPQQMAADPLHVGLDIMRERAERIGARLAVTSATDGTGTHVVIELPESRVQQISQTDKTFALLS